MKSSNPEIVFLGTPQLAVYFLDELKKRGFVPKLVITNKDKKKGRGLKISPPPVKLWAQENKIDFLQTDKVNQELLEEVKSKVNLNNTLFIVYAFGQILPKYFFKAPFYKTLNYHPSLLPKLRGPSPIRSAILKDAKDQVGGTIIEIDEKMDHGPVLAQEKLDIKSWPARGDVLDKELSSLGAKMFAEIIPKLDSIEKTPQNHKQASYTKFFKKSDMEISLSDDPYKNYLKYCAFYGIGDIFFKDNGKIVKIKEAKYENGKFIPILVTPQGKKPMSYESYLKGYGKNNN